MLQTRLHFPEIFLRQRDGHKLRGYFSDRFGADSDLFHNHTPDGKCIYRYPLIQYKVVKRHPMLIGINEGAHLLMERFLQIKRLEIEDRVYLLEQKHMKSEEVEVGVVNALKTYELMSPWQALNQKNYQIYLGLSPNEKQEQLNRILTNNILGFFKSIDCRIEQQILVTTQLTELPIAFKNKIVLGFKGSFVANVVLPDYIGLGKSVARGFGVIKKRNRER